MRLDIDNLTKNYGDLKALDNLTFSVDSGEIFGFVGSNGAGKSTTMRIALGVLDATAGEVRWDGRPIDFASRQRIGYMPEERGLYPKMKVGDQLTYLAKLHGLSSKAAETAMEEWTERLGIAERRKDLVQSLSLGNQQRVQLAAALVHDPDVLILDEPFSGLDPVAVDVMSNVLIDKARSGAPVIFSSHQLDLVERLCTRIGIIRAGSMVAVGTADELRARGGDRWALTFTQATPNAPWLAGWEGIDVLETSDKSITFLVTQPGAQHSLLAAATAIGDVEFFGRARIPLADLFRDAVTTAPKES
ncbi:ABC transporter ATP-binding protein [Jonesia quinghaiensis]|uniref:ABC transporter ATP-binding protein n=1 Tax=Jonesia quinghaiensis TaxID=262806 RepID=UPI0003FC470E|nr:ATP-binding cassette domain-containing protein [Jonesia quinghaiensis]